MINREALAAALNRAPIIAGLLAGSYTATQFLKVIEEAARERLAQLPEKCEHGQTEAHDFDNQWQGVSECPGQVYPAELVEKIVDAFDKAVIANGIGAFRSIAVAVLAALDSQSSGETP